MVPQNSLSMILSKTSLEHSTLGACVRLDDNMYINLSEYTLLEAVFSNDFCSQHQSAVNTSSAYNCSISCLTNQCITNEKPFNHSKEIHYSNRKDWYHKSQVSADEIANI